MPCCCAADAQSTEEGLFSRSKAFLAVTVSGITEGKVPTELPSGCSTIQRPPTEREEVLHCVSEGMFGCWRFVCLAATSVPSTGGNVCLGVALVGQKQVPVTSP